LLRVDELVRSRAENSEAPRKNLGDRAFGVALIALGGAVFVVAGVIIMELAKVSGPAVSKVGLWQFVRSTDWDPVRDAYGALPFIYGTLLTSIVAILIALPASVGLALFLTEMAPAKLKTIVFFPISILAGIPSVVFGLWGLFVLAPILRREVQPFLAHTLGFLPLFQGPQIGLGYLAAGIILSIMILPTITSISVEVLQTVPGSLREAALALGATRWEMIRVAVLPYARAGVLGATILGLGRALGETMAVTMVIGNSPTISASLFAPGYSLPAVIANEFAEASGMQTSALAALGLILFGVTLLLNAGARALVRLGRRGPLRVAT
jgi:phosphate transport system permease protein